MCGIVGILGNRPVAALLLDTLRRLEYRGYDSAGVATICDGALARRRAGGKLCNLEAALADRPLAGETGIGHTRWATHGPPVEANAHPHIAGRVALVHNGIIENHRALRAELTAAGAAMQSDTDTEVVAHLIDRLLAEGAGPEEAMRRTLARLEGAYALLVMIDGRADLLLAARHASPLAVGHGGGAGDEAAGEMYVGSDALALAPLTRRITYLEDGDLAVITRNGLRVTNSGGRAVERRETLTQVSGALIGKGNHRHFMEKEIHEQPEVLGYTLYRCFDPVEQRMVLPSLPVALAALPKLSIVAAGTSHYAAMIGKYWIESLARVPVEVDIASEFRHRDAVLPPGGAALFVSQSGESLDTLMALRRAREAGQHIIALVNVPESTIAREADTVLQTQAGPEIGVASTKAFTTQLMVLASLALDWAARRGTLAADRLAVLYRGLEHVPAQVAAVLEREAVCARISHDLAHASDVLYLGRGLSYPIALEGALKLKEISYIHAEGYAAGEMKHGPIALIDDGMPVIMVAPSDPWFAKTASNLREVRARGGKVILVSDAAGIAELGDQAASVIELPACEPVLSPLLYAVPVQLLAYHTALEKGTDVDQPRNLAKSVTVE